ncbi:MAG TPA: hypothetical protein ENH10_04225 [Bacteroidetes bacterium]|nr:hypothetical protein [Bacteroidota bacterium]HEX04351.1 hypothetical protein [Bacteroidota bacterium]
MANLGFLDVRKLKEEGDVKGLIAAAINVNAMWDVTDRAAEALGQIDDQSAAQQLITFLANNDRSVIKKAARALGKIGDKRAVQPLITLLNDEDDQVLNAAAEALRQIGDPQANDALAEFEDVIKGYQEDGQLARYRLAKTSLNNPLDLEVTTEKYCVYCKHLTDPNLRDSNYPKGVGDCLLQMKDASFDESCEKWRPNKKVRFWLSKGYMKHNREGWPKKPWYQVFDDGHDGEKGTH